MSVSIDRVVFNTPTVGTGDLSDGPANKPKYRNLSLAESNGDLVDVDEIGYFIEDGDAWEVGSGVWNSTLKLLSRVVNRTSNGDATAISLSGNAVVYLAETAKTLKLLHVLKDDGEGLQFLDDAGNYSTPPAQPITGAVMSYVWDTDTTATAPDTPGGIKANNSDMSLVTEIYMDDLTALSNDFSFLFSSIQNGDFIQVDENDSGPSGKDGSNTFIITDFSVDNTGWWTLKVSNVYTTGIMTNGNDVLFTFIQDPKNKLPLEGLPNEPLVKVDSTDYNTTWGKKVWFYLSSVLHGGIEAVTNGIAFFYSSDGTYDPSHGGFFVGAGTSGVHGANTYIQTLDDSTGETRSVQSVNGQIVAVPLPEPSWTLSDTDDSVVSLTTAWSAIEDGPDSLSVTTTSNEPIDEGEWIDFQIILGIENTSSNKVASVNVGIGIDGSDPTSSGINHSLAPNFSNGVVSAVSVQAPAGGYPTGTVFKVYAQKVGSDGVPIVDGTVTEHILKVSKNTSGGSGQPAPTIVQHNQSADGNLLTISDNTIVELTPDGNSMTIDIASPNVISQLHILSGPSDVTWSGPVASDWPGGSVPDTSNGRHTIGVQRTATQYTMTHQAHQ